MMKVICLFALAMVQMDKVYGQHVGPPEFTETGTASDGYPIGRNASTQSLAESPSEAPSKSLSHNTNADDDMTTYSDTFCTDVIEFKTVDSSTGFFTGVTCEQISEFPNFWCDKLEPYADADGQKTTDACCSCGGGFSTCTDQPNWYWDETEKSGCDKVTAGFCDALKSIWYDGKNVELACCVCGGGYHVPFAPSSNPSTEPSLSNAPSQTQCVDDPASWYDVESTNFDCAWYGEKRNCDVYGDSYSNFGKTANEACCVCGGGAIPSPLAVTSMSPSQNPDFARGYIGSQLSVGERHTCAIFQESLKCWGSNYYGQLGLGPDVTHSYTPTNVPLGQDRYAVAVTLGRTHTCAILDDNSTKCWGRNKLGQLGFGATGYATFTPQLVTVIDQDRYAVAIALYENHSCALLDNKVLRCWGLNYDGQLGDNNYYDDGNPPYQGIDNQKGTDVLFDQDRYAVAIGVGSMHTCAILDDKSLKCWGNNNKGQLGDSTKVQRNAPTDVPLDVGVVAIALGFEHTCAILEDSSLKCWGSNEYRKVYHVKGDLPTPTTIDVASGEDKHAVAIGVGWQHSCAILDDNSMKCWGLNNHGQLGGGSPDDGNYEDSPTTVASIGQDEKVVAVAVGDYHTCVIFDDQTVKCCGWNSDGQLGDGTTTDSIILV